MARFGGLPAELKLTILEQAKSFGDLVHLCDSDPDLRDLFNLYSRQVTTAVTRNYEEKTAGNIRHIVAVKAGIVALRGDLYEYNDGTIKVLYSPFYKKDVCSPNPLTRMRAYHKLDKNIHAITDLCVSQANLGYVRFLDKSVSEHRQLYGRAVEKLVRIVLLVKGMDNSAEEFEDTGILVFNNVETSKCTTARARLYKEPLGRAKVHAVIQALRDYLSFDELLALGDVLIIIRSCMDPEDYLYHKMWELQHNDTFLTLCDTQISEELWGSRLLAYAWMVIRHHDDRHVATNGVWFGRERDHVFHKMAKYIEPQDPRGTNLHAEEDSSDDGEMIPAPPSHPLPVGWRLRATVQPSPRALRKVPWHLRIKESCLKNGTRAIVEMALRL